MRYSSVRNDIVINCFSGSRPCLTAAQKHKRRVYLIEQNPYCDITIRLWMNLIGKKPH